MAETKVKVCGLTRSEDAVHAEKAGADFLGVVLVPDTPRFQTPEQAKVTLSGIVMPTVVVVADLGRSDTIRVAEMVGADVIQLHGEESPELVSALSQDGPWEVWKALRVRDASDLRAGLECYGSVADGLLLDAWHPEKSGGTGVVFSWEEVAEVRGEVSEDLRFVVAGGLTPENVREAVVRLRPDVVDVSSGVEQRPGVKDQWKVETFIRNVRGEKVGGRR